MNCKACGGTTTAQTKVIKGRPTILYECNQDNGTCLNARGYPTSTFATGNGARAPQRSAPPVAPTPANGSDLSKWQTCLNCAARVNSMKTTATAKEVIAFATELFLAPVPKLAPVAKPAPKPAPEPEPEAEDAEVY